MSESEAPKQFSYGGQAVIEGVLMRGAHKAAVAVRNPRGQIVIHETDLNTALYRGRIAKTPFLRGLVLLWDALGLGTRALMWAADVALDEGEEEETPSFDGPLGWATITVSMLIGLGLFMLLPTAAAGGFVNLIGLGGAEATAEAGATLNALVANLAEGVVRLILLIAYIWAIGRMPDVARLFGYHGAEHKTINAYEAGDDLIPDVVQNHSIEHPRCGTAFLLNVVIVSILFFSVVDLLTGRAWWVIPLTRIAFIPVIAGIAYELLRFTAKNADHPIIGALIKPNLALQHLTTREPDLHMIEVAITAFKRVLLSEGVIDEEDARIPEANPEAASPIGGAAPATGD